jgi:cellobiose transport system permease protein
MTQATEVFTPAPQSSRTTYRFIRFWRKYGMPYLFISPFFISFIIFSLFPLIYALFMGFHKWDGMSPPQFVGLQNYIRLVTKDIFFQTSVKNTIMIGLLVMIPKLTIALLVAVALHIGRMRFRDFFQVAYFLPIITSPVAVAIIFLTIYGQQTGILNYLITQLGFEPVRWLHDPTTIKPAIIILIIWHEVGWYMVIYMAGLQSIPQDLYDAASVDGANAIQGFFNVTLPMLSSVILFTVIIDIIGELQIFAEPFVLVGANGGTNREGLTMSMYLFQSAFTNMRLGYSSAQSYLMFLMIAVISLINLKVFHRPGGIR